jgi:hypothetical protein
METCAKNAAVRIWCLPGGDDGSGSATVWRNTGTSSPCRSRSTIITYAHVHSDTAAATSAGADYSAIKQRRELQ